MDDEEPPIREFADRGVIWLLGAPGFLSTFLSILSAEITGRLDLSRARRINRSLIPDDLRNRETDLIVLVPYRDDSREVLIYVLLEHQSEQDHTMPFRVLRQMVYLWDQECRTLQDAGVPRNQWQIHLIIPIVFYTGTGSWQAPVLHQMVEMAAGLEDFVPAHRTLFLNLGETAPETLISTKSPLGWVLRAFQSVHSDLEELSAVVRDAVAFLETLPEDAQGDWIRAMHFLLLLIRHNREPGERERLYEVVFEGARRHREKLQEIEMTDAQWLMNEGLERGSIREARQILLRLGGRQFGPADAETLAAINGISRLSDLERLIDAILDSTDWKTLLSHLPVAPPTTQIH